MKKVIVLTGDEMRHNYFRVMLASDDRFEVINSYCEGTEKSLESRTRANIDSTPLERLHVEARSQTEKDFFAEIIKVIPDKSRPIKITKGAINERQVVDSIIDKSPDLLICYGSSLIKSKLLELYENRFLNVHLGLSPYYRGSGTNIWPLINEEPYMVGATFMYIDAGIDTGKIIHQIRADIFLGDTPHTIGNRLIKKMTSSYADIVAFFDLLSNEPQLAVSGKLYKQRDFDGQACAKLYQNFSNNMIEKYLSSGLSAKVPNIIENRALAG